MTDDEKRELIVTARHLEEMWKKAEHPFSETEFLESDALAELHATGFVAVQNARRLADALEGTLTGSETPSPGKRLDPEFRAQLVDFAAGTIQDVTQGCGCA